MTTTVHQNALTRRSFLKAIGGATAAGVVLPLFDKGYAWADPLGGNGPTLAVVFLRGGMDGLSALPPIEDGGYYDRRRTIAVPANQASPLDRGFGLHPALAPLVGAWQAGRMAAVVGMATGLPSRSHFEQFQTVDRGSPDPAAVHGGWLGRHLAALTPSGSVPAASLTPTLPPAFAGTANAVAIDDLASFGLAATPPEQRPAVMQALARLWTGSDTLSQVGSAALQAIQAVEASGAASIAPANGAVYPEHPWAPAFRQAAQLVHAGVGLRVAWIDLPGWDTHATMGTSDAGTMRNQLSGLADNLAAFDADVAGKNVTTVVYSEFGRRVAENASGGTDHGRAGVAFVLGDGVRGGVYGPWYGLGNDVLDNGDVPKTVDIRDVLAEIVDRRLANPAVDLVFPEYQPSYLGFT